MCKTRFGSRSMWIPVVGFLLLSGCDSGSDSVWRNSNPDTDNMPVVYATDPGQRSEELAAPVRLSAGGELIDTEVGHAAPYVTDFDGDGLNDLLVGQFGEGKLKTCLNKGTNKQPEYAAPEWFKAADEIVKSDVG